MNDTFAMRLARLRAQKGMTQRDLGEAIGISWSQVSRYEAGKAAPRLPVLMRIADALGTTIETLQGVPGAEGREITFKLSGDQTQKVEDFANSQGLSFNDAIQRIVMQGLKMKMDGDPDTMAKLEAEIPGAYDKLVKLLSREG